MEKQSDIVKILPDAGRKGPEVWKYIAISTGILAAYHLLTHPLSFWMNARLTDYAIVVLPLCFYFLYRSQFGQRRKFLSWSAGEFEYHLVKTQGRISFSELSELRFDMERLRLVLKDGRTIVVDLKDYYDPRTREQIRLNFEKAGVRVQNGHRSL